MVPVMDRSRRRTLTATAGPAAPPSARTSTPPERHGLGMLHRLRSKKSGRHDFRAQRGLTPATKAKVAKRTDWVHRAYDAYENIPEVGFVVDLSATTMALGRLRLQWKNEIGEWQDPRVGLMTDDDQPIPDDETDLLMVELLATFEPEDGEQSDLAERFAINDQIAGECYLIAKAPTRADIKTGIAADVEVTSMGNTRFAWDIYSVLELDTDKMAAGKIQLNTGGARGMLAAVEDTLPDDAYLARYWRRDPRKSDQATSSIRRVLPICDELQALNRAILTAVQSQSNSGVMIIVDGMRLFGGGDESAETDEDDIGLIAAELEEHFTSTADAGDEGLRAPLIFIAPTIETAGAIRMVDTWREFDSVLIELRTAARGTLAIGVDAPPEVLTGKAGLSHWTGYSVDQDFLLRHIQPRGNRWARFVTSDMLRPMAELNDRFDGDVERYKVIFDVSPLTAKPDMTGTVLELDKRDELSPGATLRLLGVDQADAASDEERGDRIARRLAEKLPSFAVLFAARLNLPELEGLNWQDFIKLGTGSSGDGSSAGPEVKTDPGAGPDGSDVNPTPPSPK